MGHRRWIAFLASLLLIAAAHQAFPEDDGGPGPATVATTGAAVETQRTPVEGPPLLRSADIESLLAALDSDLFKVRHEARTRLESLAFLPDVAKAMEARLKVTADAEVRESLKPLLARRKEMLLMVWGNSVQSAAAPGRPPQFLSGPAGGNHPWLYVGGDGSFVYEAASVLFTRKVPMPTESDVRMGRLTGEQLMAVAEMLRRFPALPRESPARELPARPTSAPGRDESTNAVIDVMVYLRLPQKPVLWDNRTWPLEQFRRPEGKAADIHLAAALCEMLAACPSGPYEGDMGLSLAGGPQGADASKLPEWPADDVGFSFSDVSKHVVYPLSPDELKAVRQALKAKPLYRSGTVALRPYLTPYIRQAMAVRLGHEPAEGKP